MQIKVKSVVFVLVLSAILLCGAGTAAQVFSTSVPISFIRNDGQTDEQVLYFADAAGYTLYLTPEGEVISTAEPVSVLTISYTGSSPSVVVTPGNELGGKANFLIGDEDAWVTNVPMFGSVRYDGLYDGISLVYKGGPGILKKEFIVEPGAEPSAIVMQYAGQEGIILDDNGALLVTTAAGTFIESPPVCYQVIDGEQADIACSYTIGDDGVVTFAVGAYNKALPLTIDPQYDFSTYLGGAQDDKGAGVGMDDLGNVYVVGSTQSTQFPLSNGPVFQEKLNGSWDIFATAFGPDQPDYPLYSTYIGGNSTDIARGMVVNNATGAVTFTGYTLSVDYPRTMDPPKYNLSDVIVTRLAPDGASLQMSRLIGGNKSDEGYAIARRDGTNVVAVVGSTASIDFPNTTADPYNGATDAFVAVVGAGGTIQGCRYLGGGGTDVAYGVAIDTANQVYVTGGTNSGGLGKFPVFPTTGSAFRNYLKGDTDAFITKLNNVGENIIYSTYLGGTKVDVGTAIDVDSNFYPYITGYTSSSDPNPNNLFPIFPTTVFQPAFGGGTASGPWDAFITKMKPDLSAMNYSTFLGGLYDEKAYGIAVDSNGTAFVTGYTNSENFPITYNCTTQPVKGLGYLVPDAFITQMNQNGTGLLFSTYLGGTYYDEGSAIAITDDGLNITVTGYTESINFPVVNAYQPNLAGFPAVRFTDAFVTKIVKLPPVANFTSIPYPATGCTPLTVYFTDTSTNNPTSWFWDFGDNSADNTSTEQNPNHTYVNTNVNAAKNFTVNLTACNCDGCNTTSMVNFTRVCPQPFADFAANNTTGCLNLGNATIQFNLTAYSGGVRTGPALKWNWSFGDGNYSLVNFSNVNVTHTYYTMNGTSNFTVSLTYENSCCNNTTTKLEYIDIRDQPDADFYAIPTSGLIPLDVDFFDNSTGRPSSWFWRFGSGEGTSTDQNPEHTYSSKGAYTVRMQACNFCGCDWKNETAFIKAGVPNLTFNPDVLVVPTNDTTPIELFLQAAEDGLSGYDLNVFWDDSVHGDITAVTFPPWASDTEVSALPDYFVQIKAVDMTDQVNPGATNVLLAKFNLTGNISTFQSNITFNVTVNELDDNYGNPIYTNNIPATITVVRLLWFRDPAYPVLRPTPMETRNTGM